VTVAHPVKWETFVAYWAGDLPEEEELTLEEHLFACAECTRESARVAAVTETLRASIPPLLTPELYARLRAKGLRCLENPMLPGERKEQRFPRDVELLVHRLGGLDLADAENVHFTLRQEGTDHVMASMENAPFDRAGNAVLLACQHHYASLPPDTVAEIRVKDRSGREHVATYTILHHFE
jgi:hypothetical protein